MMISYISTSLYPYLPLYIHSNSIRQQPSNCVYKPNTADISLTSPLYGSLLAEVCLVVPRRERPLLAGKLYGVFVSLKKCFSLYTGLPLFLFLFFLDNEETDSAEFETR